jgi:short-subunit dehydrogenase
MTKIFKEKYGDWALVTGATSGIGAEIANQLAAKGLNIVLVARKEKELIENAARIKQLYNVDTSYISADISTKEGI